MPESRETPDDEKIENLTRQADSVSAEGDIDIISEERAQRDMPSAPETGYRS